MRDLQSLTEEDLKGLAPEAVAALCQQMLQRLRCQDSELKFKDAKIEKITFQLAQLKAWKFSAKTEAMSTEQRRLFEKRWLRMRPVCRHNSTRPRALPRRQPARVATGNPSLVAARCPNTCGAKHITTNLRAPTARTRSAVAL